MFHLLENYLKQKYVCTCKNKMLDDNNSTKNRRKMEVLIYGYKVLTFYRK